MSEEELRRLMKTTFDVDEPLGLESRVRAALRHAGRPREVTPALISAIALPIVAVVFLSWAVVRLTASPTPSRPVPASSPLSNPTPSTSLPASDLESAQLTNVGDRISGYDLSGQAGGNTVKLLAAYADAGRVVIFLSVEGDANGIAASLKDDGGVINSSTRFGRASTGHWILQWNAELRPSKGGASGVRLGVSFPRPVPSARPTPPYPPLRSEVDPGPVFNFSLQLQSSARLSSTDRFKAGNASYTLYPIVLSPNAIVVTGEESGRSIDFLTGDPPKGAFQPRVIGPSGQQLRSIEGGMGVLNSVTDLWLRFAWVREGPGTYRILFNWGGQPFEREVVVR